MTESDYYDEIKFDEWDDPDEEGLDSVVRWRRPLLIAVAAITAVALAIVPLYNVLFSRTVADNGLEVCGFDYCIVQDAVREAGGDVTMSRLSNVFLTEDEARALANELTAHLGIERVGLQVVERLDGRLGGFYDPATRTVSIESPARAWTVLHEVAHAVEDGHDARFQQVVIELALSLATDQEVAGG